MGITPTIPTEYRIVEDNETIGPNDLCTWYTANGSTTWLEVQNSTGHTPSRYRAKGSVYKSLVWITKSPPADKEWLNPWDT